MKRPEKIFFIVGLLSIGALASRVWTQRVSLRDSVGEASLLESLGDPGNVIQGLRKEETMPAAAGSAIDGSSWESACSLAESLAAGEFKILYRGSHQPPRKVFQAGFVSLGEDERDSHRLAADASLESVRRHVQENEFPSPYISTSRDITATMKFGYKGWVYLIRTNRGVDSVQRLQKMAEHRRKNEKGLLRQGGRKLEEERLVPIFKGEEEVLVPGHIPSEEILGAWRLLKANDGRNPRKQRLFERFIPNPNYAGPVPVSGDICPPSFSYWDAQNHEDPEPEID